MVLLVDAVGDLRVGVAAQVGPLLPRQADEDAGIVVTCRGDTVWLPLRGGYLQPRPLPPQIQSTGRFHKLLDIGPADAGGYLQEVVAAVGSANELGVGCAPLQAEGGQQPAVQVEDSLRLVPLR